MEHDRAGHAARSTHHCMLAGYFALQGGEVLSRSCPCRHDWLCRAAAGALPLMGHMMQQGAGQGSADAAHVCRAVPAARAVPAVQRLGGRAAAALLPARPGCRPLRGAGQLGRRRAGRAARLRRACRAGGRARRAAAPSPGRAAPAATASTPSAPAPAPHPYRLHRPALSSPYRSVIFTGSSTARRRGLEAASMRSAGST